MRGEKPAPRHRPVNDPTPLLAASGLLLLLFLLVARGLRRESKRHEAPPPAEQIPFLALEGALRDASRDRAALARERDRAEARRREVERLQAQILGSLGSGVVALDRAGRVRTANAAAGRILGRHPLTLVGEPLEASLPAPALSEWVARVVATGEAVERQEVVLPLERGERWLGVSVSPLEDAAGRRSGAVILFSDLTEVRRLREQVEARMRLDSMGEMLAAIVHECRNAMGAVGGYARLLERPELPEGERRLAVEGILEEIGSMEAVLGDCLDYVRPRPPRRRAVRLGELAREVARAAAAGSGDGVSVTVQAPEEVVVQGDPDQLRRALANVVRNAVEASPAGSPVELRVEPRGAEAAVAVVDRGCGMAEEVREHLCDPFFTTRADGTGLGMSIVARILDAHGGRLEVESREGEGSTVRLLLPREAA
ncbi:MAG: PAS domain-containing protein [Nitrospirae bacterium]|nr:MAG: PAS domain-containing protein [Nitrospirota bacterium]